MKFKAFSMHKLNVGSTYDFCLRETRMLFIIKG
uniref:Uncharacterized protein n=1 Tax=Arundo donax TaxID=35708 RepID=A0A0A8YUK3_ARUDO